MKCAECGHDAKKTDREGGKCPSCRAEYAFDPSAGSPVTDLAFTNALARVSGEGQVRWLPEHLYYELARKDRPKPVRAAVILAIVGVIGALFTFGLALLPVGLFAAWYAFTYRARHVKLDRDRFRLLLERWSKVKGEPAGQVRPATRRPARRSKETEEELMAYSFDRAVITDDPTIVDVLVANNFHFENNCALLSIDGHPADAFDAVRRMLKNNPRLLVLAAHHATPEGCTLARRLATDPAWFKDQGVRIVDVGLRPIHGPLFSGLLGAGHPVKPGRGISASEAAWLSKHSISLHAVRPEQLVKRLHRGFTRAEDGAAAGVDGSSSTVDVMGSDADMSDGGGDSFG